MSNAALSICSMDGQVLHYISEPKIAPDGAESVAVIRGMSPTHQALGFRTGQKASYDISFTTPIVEGTQEYNWIAAAEEKREGVFTVETGSVRTIYKVKVVSAGHDVQGDTTADMPVTLKALHRRVA